MRFLAFRDSYTTRWEIQFIFTAFSCPVVGPVRRADWRQARLLNTLPTKTRLGLSACRTELACVCRRKPARTETRNFAPRQGAWGAGRLRPPERAPDKLFKCPLFLRWTALDSKSEKWHQKTKGDTLDQQAPHSPHII